MKKLFFPVSLLFFLLLCSCNQSSPLDLSEIDPGRYDSTWYNRAPLRHIQTNLREIDADMDVDRYIQALVDASASVVTFNTGGIRAFYPTKLPYHYKSPYLKGDLVGEVLDRFHENGIKFIARFDMSKVHESIAKDHPDWLYVGTDGKVVNYNGEVHTCIMGDYQQVYAFKILEEALSTYPVDGVFFNNAGFTTMDYSQVQHGLCQCNNCKRGFRKAKGLALPVIADVNDPIYREYRNWQQDIIATHTKRIKDFFSDLDPGLVYFNREGDVYRSESGTAFTSRDYWTYHGTENTKRVLNSNKHQMPSDTYNYLLGMDYRHTATSPNIGRIFLTEHMLNGGSPGIYFIGRIENQLDREFIPGINELFGFHKSYEKLFTNVESLAKVGLVMGASEDYRGMMRLLTEEHILYDLIRSNALGSEDLPRQLKSYQVIILSNVSQLDPLASKLIDNWVAAGGKLLVTGFPEISEGNTLPCLGIKNDTEHYPRTRSTYLKVEASDKVALGPDRFRDFDVMLMNSDFLKCTPQAGTKGLLKLVPETMHGPPEKCYFTESDVSNFPGMLVNAYGKGTSVFIPWLIGSQYHWRGNNAHRALFLSSLETLLNHERDLITDASSLIEMTHLGNLNGSFEWIGMLNHSGQIGDVYRKPVPIYNTNIRFKTLKPVERVYLLRSGETLNFRQSEGWLDCVIPELRDFEMILCLYKDSENN